MPVSSENLAGGTWPLWLSMVRPLLQLFRLLWPEIS